MRIARRWFSPSRRTLAFLVPVVLSCDAAAVLESPHPVELRTLALSDAPKDAALFIGNLVPGAPGNGIFRYDGRGALLDRVTPGGCCMAFGPDENLYVTNAMAIHRFNGVTGEFIDVVVPADPSGRIIAFIPVFGPDGNLYVSDRGAARAIRRYVGTTGTLDPSFYVDGAARGLATGDPQFYGFGPDGNLYVTSQQTHRVLRFSGVNGAFIDEFVSEGEGGLERPSGLVFGPDGTLYVGSPPTDRVLRFDREGTYIGDFFPAGSGGLDLPVGLTFGPDGDFYVAAAAAPSTAGVLRYDGTTGAFIGAFVGPGDGVITGPRAVLFKSRIAMCHRPDVKGGKPQTISIGYLSAQNHVVHGDRVGPCAS